MAIDPNMKLTAEEIMRSSENGVFNYIMSEIPTGRFISKIVYVGRVDVYQTDKYFSAGLVFENIKTNWWTRLCMSLFLGVKWKKERRKIYDPGRQPKTVSKQKN